MIKVGQCSRRDSPTTGPTETLGGEGGTLVSDECHLSKSPETNDNQSRTPKAYLLYVEGKIYNN